MAVVIGPTEHGGTHVIHYNGSTIEPVDVAANAQPHDETLDALAALNSTPGAVEQTGADAFTKRPFGVAAPTDILTRADGDGRYAPVAVTGYTDEQAQDAVGAMVDTSLVYNDATPLLTRAALTGDVTAAQGSNATAIANNAVTNAKAADMATQTIKGRDTAGTGDPEDLAPATARTLLGLVIGTTIQAFNALLGAIAGLATNGLIVRTAAGTAAARSIAVPATGLSISNADGVSGNPTIALANDLAALEGLSSTGLAARTATDTWAQRTITGTTNQITVTNGSGAGGNPTLGLPQDIHTGADVQFTYGRFTTHIGLGFNGLPPSGYGLEVRSPTSGDFQMRIGTATNYYNIGRNGSADGLLHIEGNQSAPYNGMQLDTGNFKVNAGKLLTSAGLGVGNATNPSSSIPGDAIKKVEIFNASGVSLGFIAVDEDF